MNKVFLAMRFALCLGVDLLVFGISPPREAAAQLAGTFHSAPGTMATYQYQPNGFETVMLPADITVTFSGDTPTSMLTATIHKPIIGDTAGNFNFPIVNEFPLVVTGTSSDGREFEGQLLVNSQYYFDWQFEPAEGGELKWNGMVSWVGGRIEVSTITDARLIPGVPGDYNHNGTVDAGDYVVWRNGLDTIYTQDDYDVWRSHFGQTAASGAVLPSAEPLSVTVPEPASALLVLVFGAAVSIRRRTRIAH